MFRAYTDWQAQYGDTFKIFFVRRPVLVTTGQLALVAWTADQGSTQVGTASQRKMSTYLSQDVFGADPALVRQITVKDFNKFRDRFIPNFEHSVRSGKRLEASQSGMVVAR